MGKLSKLLLTIYFLLFTLFSIYSYAFLDVGLTLTSFKPYLDFQKKMQWWGYFNRGESTIVFIILAILLFTVYCLLFILFKKRKISLKKIIILAVTICLILVFSYPAFSHDIFNYIFNAKMVVIFKADPHKQVAMDFPDPMLGFMRNIHTPAPYFYGWTLTSLAPFILGFNRIFPEIISFKLFSVFSLFLTAFILNKIYSILKFKNGKLRLTLFLLNPLILIETISIGHNDLAMMVLAFLGFYFLVRSKQEKKLLFAVCCLLFTCASISIKYATLILLPIFLIWYLKPKFDLGLWGSLLLFLLPFTRPLDQLHSWYLIWPLTWSLLAKKPKVFYFFVLLSCFALLRYAPYIYYGNWDPPVTQLRLWIYFLIPLI